MLSELKVNQFAIIDQLSIQFENGLNIISGETGAGKSVILKCLSLLMGQKSSTSIIQQGKNSATVIGAFDLTSRNDISAKLEDLGVPTDEEQLIVRRVLSLNGKSKVYLNDQLTTLATLKNVVAPLIELTNQDAPLIEMTAQHENKNLQSINYQLDLLDIYSNLWSVRKKFQSKYIAFQKLTSEINDLEAAQPNNEQRLDFLKYQLNEINNLKLKPGEEKDLEENIKLLKNSHHLVDYINELEFHLYSSENSCLVILHNLIQKSNDFNKVSSKLSSQLEPLRQAKTLIEETLYDFRDFSKNMDTNCSELNELEDTLDSLRKLQRKYGKTVQEIYEQKEEIENEIFDIENYDNKIIELKINADKELSELLKLSSSLHKSRLNSSKKFQDKINLELLDLNMKGVEFIIELTETDELSINGTTSVNYLIKQNKKDLPKPINKVASGGELSRILLSIKKVIGNIDVPRTFLFDEVDTGVSGPTAEKVGKKLKEISHGQQVICVTHLPQVAAYADQHYLIDKANKNNKTKLSMLKLSEADQVKEIARLISGEKITKTSLAHAKQLLNY